MKGDRNMSRFRTVAHLVHDVVGEWELNCGYDIVDSDRALLAMRIVDAFKIEYGIARVHNDNYVLMPAELPTNDAA